jgi:alpha-tubulin suppressor-like RCC1 family protein
MLKLPVIVLVKGLQDKQIVQIACGVNHSLARDKDGYVYSWGFGGYGRLGHGEQKDAMVPQSISVFASSSEMARSTDIACGATCSMALDGQKQVLLWGKWKNTGDGSSGQPWMVRICFYLLTLRDIYTQCIFCSKKRV